MNSRLRMMIGAAILATAASLGLGMPSASAQNYGGHRHHAGCGHAGYAPGSWGYGYSYGSSYYSQGHYTRPFGYSTYGGYAPGRGSYFGSSYYGRGYGYSSYFGSYR